jgi:hypothetical protein
MLHKGSAAIQRMLGLIKIDPFRVIFHKFTCSLP